MTTPDPDVQGADDTKQVSKDQPDCQPIPEGERGGEERCPTCGGEADKPRCRHLIGWNDPLTPEQREQLRCKDPFHHPAKASSRASSEPASGEGLEGVDRFTPARQYWGTMEPNPEGAWVRYSDASAALEAERRQTEEEAGRAIDFALLIKGHKDRADAAEKRAEEAEEARDDFAKLLDWETKDRQHQIDLKRRGRERLMAHYEAKLTRIEKLVEWALEPEQPWRESDEPQERERFRAIQAELGWRGCGGGGGVKRSLVPFAVAALAGCVTATVITAGLAVYALVVLVALGVLAFGFFWEFGLPAAGEEKGERDA